MTRFKKKGMGKEAKEVSNYAEKCQAGCNRWIIFNTE
jgi:hypothetical protein